MRRVLSPETYEILFYDGFRKTVQAANVRDMTEEVQQEVGRRQVAPAVQALGCTARWRRWAAAGSRSDSSAAYSYSKSVSPRVKT